MTKFETYKKLRDEFGSKLENLAYEAELTAWDFYTDSTNDNMHKYADAQENMSNLYKDEELYKKFREIKNEGLEDKHLNKQIKDIVKLNKRNN